jgi:hypothetical protein
MLQVCNPFNEFIVGHFFDFANGLTKAVSESDNHQAVIA